MYEYISGVCKKACLLIVEIVRFVVRGPSPKELYMSMLKEYRVAGSSPPTV